MWKDVDNFLEDPSCDLYFSFFFLRVFLGAGSGLQASIMIAVFLPYFIF